MIDPTKNRNEEKRKKRRERYQKNREKELAQNKAWAAQNPDKVKAKMKRWSAKNLAEYRKNPENKQRHAARQFINNAIRDGKLIRQPCEECGLEPAEAHHEDYSKPSDVRWLCKTHHSEHHKLERAKNANRS